MTLIAAEGYANSLVDLGCFQEARSLIRRTMPVARRVFGDSKEDTLKMRGHYAKALYLDAGAMLDDLREAVTTLEDSERTVRRVFGGAHPTAVDIERSLRAARAALAVREAEAVRVAECDSLQRDNDALERPRAATRRPRTGGCTSGGTRRVEKGRRRHKTAPRCDPSANRGA